MRTELANLDYNFRTATDTEVLLIAYAHWGSACFNRFNGMWAFASEVKALLRHPAMERRPNSEGVFYYLSGLTHEPFGENTWFDNIKAVPPGSYLTLR